MKPACIKARVAGKSCGQQCPYGFDSRPEHIKERLTEARCSLSGVLFWTARRPSVSFVESELFGTCTFYHDCTVADLHTELSGLKYPLPVRTYKGQVLS